MLKYRYEIMFPYQLREVLEKNPIVYLPVSPIEWHGEHLIFGTDPFRARRVLEIVWEKLGGVMMPTLYVGTDGTIVEDGEEFWGMEMFAKEKIPGSVFVRKETFYNLLKDMLSFLERTGFKLCVLCTGHMAKSQVEVVEKLEEEYMERSMKVISWHWGKVKYPEELVTNNPLHAGVEESSEILSIDLSYVDLDRVGGMEVDRKVGLTKGNLENISEKLGESRFNFEAEELIKKILKCYNKES
ncbi:MAG: creatininase family protein [Dictyoglomus thermophilum]|nr:creatininase family protein [Dictyoglomus thermophilum]MCX7720203.1 creatininase family protein [Dictyoglomus thermophilum]